MNSVWRFALAMAIAVVAAVPPIAAQDDPDEEGLEIVNTMHDRLEQITDIRASLVMGSLEGARAPARQIAAEESTPGLPTQFEPFVESLRAQARNVVEAEDVASAATAVSMMAQGCGNCHMANSVGLQFGYDQLPADWSDTQTHMQRHQWAIDRMWDGLVGPSVRAWDRGVGVLGEEALRSDYIVGVKSAQVAESIDRIAARLHEVGGLGANASTPSARAEVYGELISLCADCHTMLGRGPGN